MFKNNVLVITIFILLTIGLILGSLFLFVEQPEEIVEPPLIEREEVDLTEDKRDLIYTEDVKNSFVVPNFILWDVPFTPQAPFAQWSDPVYQNACEEATLVMAMRWVKEKSLTPKEASEEIFAISDFEKEKYGHFHDTSAQDTLKTFKDFYNYQKAEVFYDINRDDIKKALAKGSLVIVPVDGRKLGNPYYTPPGPQEHMLLIRGYDDTKGEFIVNDPGTKRGEEYRYKYQILEKAMRDYPTGYHEPTIDPQTAMIVVRR